MTEIDALVKSSQDQFWPCVLCGAETRQRGVFQPNKHSRINNFQPPNGKVRYFVYALCQAHEFCSKTAEQVEIVLAANNLFEPFRGE